MKTYVEIQKNALLRHKSTKNKKSRKQRLQFIENPNSGQRIVYSFQNVFQLDQFLLEREDVDIWQIKDQCYQYDPQVIYKRKNVWGKLEAYTSKQDLYQEISRDSDGAFEIHNTSHDINNPQKTFIIDESGWFKTKFTEYPSEIDFQRALNKSDNDSNDDNIYKKIFWGLLSGLVLFSESYAGYLFLNPVANKHSTDKNNTINNPFDLMYSRQNNYWDGIKSNFDYNSQTSCLAGLALGAVGTSTTHYFSLILAGMSCLSSRVVEAATFPSVLELSDLDGTNGFKMNGEAAGDGSGNAVSCAGDFNGDGISDFIIGASFADPHGKSAAGSSYVIFGQAKKWASSVELSSLNLNNINGFKINGEITNDNMGASVGAGDINGDGKKDLIIGAKGADPNGKSDAGSTYGIFNNGGWTTPLETSTFDGINGFKINGEEASSMSGVTVNSGDINHDGIDDLIISAPYGTANGKIEAGLTYVVFGHNESWNMPFELSTLNGINGFKINGEKEGDSASISIGVGDVNNDGISDIIIGAIGGDPHGQNGAGMVYIVFGKSGLWENKVELSTLDGINGFKVNGEEPGANTGRAVGVGDVNGDGKDDIIIGAYRASPHNKTQAGSSYVIFGREGSWESVLELSALNGNNGFKINGEAAGDWSGFSIGANGDINGDGKKDFIIGADSASPYGQSKAGSSYVIFGREEPWKPVLELSTLNGENGFKINGEASGDWSGYAINFVQDVNGDGIDDLIIGAPLASPNGKPSAGSSYVIFGCRKNPPPSSFNYKNILIGGVGALIGLIVFLMMYRYYQKKNREHAIQHEKSVIASPEEIKMSYFSDTSVSTIFEPGKLSFFARNRDGFYAEAPSSASEINISSELRDPVPNLVDDFEP